MAGISLEMRLRQELKLQPRQIICNELLMLPLLDLEAALNAELEENVFLEAAEQQETGVSAAELPRETQATPPGGDEEPGTGGEEAAQDAGTLGDMLEYFAQSKTSTASISGDLPDAFDADIRSSKPTPWRTSLIEALRLERLGDDVERAAIYMADCLDERGFLMEPLEDIAKALNVDMELAEEALDALQRVAPAGCGARDLREKLLLICQTGANPNPVLERLVRECFDDLLHGKFDRIQKRLGLDEDEMREALLDLKEIYHEAVPMEEGEPAAPVTPDATVEKDKDGNWRVILHDESVPQLRLSKYAAELSKQGDNLSAEAQEYLNRAYHRARWIMDALEQRRTTLRRIVDAVVERQVHYFDEGPGHLEPLRQEDVANQLNLHPSTVSRAVQDKYIEGPHGVLSLKDFFPRGVAGTHGEQQARDSVKDKLQAIVDGEDPEAPHSDDVLVKLLKKAGVKLSRRTVCKYRDELQIPPASKRKGIYRVMSPGSS